MVEFPDSSPNMGTSASWFLVLGDYVLVGWWIWAGNVKVFGIISGRDNPKTEVLLWHNQFDQAAIVLNQKKQIRDITIKYQVLGKYFFTVYLLKPQTIQIFKDEQLIMWFIRGEKKRKATFFHPNLRLPRARPLFLTHDNIWLCPNHLPDNSSTYWSDRWTTTSYRQNQYIPNFSAFIKCTPTQIVSVITGNGTPRLLYLFTVYLATLMPFLLYVQHSKVLYMSEKI